MRKRKKKCFSVTELLKGEHLKYLRSFKHVVAKNLSKRVPAFLREKLMCFHSAGNKKKTQ